MLQGKRNAAGPRLATAASTTRRARSPVAGGAPLTRGAPRRASDQYFEIVETNLEVMEPIPVMLSKPGLVVRDTLRVAQLFVASQ